MELGVSSLFVRKATMMVAAVLLAALLTAAGATARDSDQAATRPRVVLVTAVGCGDAYQRLVCGGFQKALRATGATGRIVNPTDREDPADTLELLARQGYDLVIVSGFQFYEPLGEAARRQPRAHFAIMDAPRADVSGSPANVQGVVFRTSEGAYLAGWLAAQLERRESGPDVVGVVAGIKLLSVQDLVIGFRAGAHRASPDTRVLVGYSSDFVDPTKCEAIARSQIAKGAGAVFNVAGTCGLGTIEAAGRAGVWAIGVDSDQSFLGAHVLTSVVKHFDKGFLALLRPLKEGKLGTGRDTVLTVGDDAVGLGKISPKVPKSVRAGVEKLHRDIAAGRVRVPGVYPDPR